MEQRVRAIIEFDASHIDTTRVRCERRHGHHWTISVEKVGKEDGLETDLHALIAEWQDRDLNEMLPGAGWVSVENLAAWTMERLLLRHPTIICVECGDGRLTGIVWQDLRR